MILWIVLELCVPLSDSCVKLHVMYATKYTGSRSAHAGYRNGQKSTTEKLSFTPIIDSCNIFFHYYIDMITHGTLGSTRWRHQSDELIHGSVIDKLL